MSTYPHERQIEYWVSRAIEDYFDNQGYDIVVLPNTQTAENSIPYDHLFIGKRIKVFGFQYKRLIQAKSDYWSINIDQLSQISRFKWIYYALPEITSIRQHRNALHLLAIVKAVSLKNQFKRVASGERRLLHSELGVGFQKVPYYRWGKFVQKLFDCSAGWHPRSRNELLIFLRESRDIYQELIDIYLIPMDIQDSRLAIRLVSSRSLDPEEKLDYDFGFDAEDQG